MRNRNYSIDILKIVCAFLVVCIHVSSNWEYFFKPITRCAVPCFFMISGYLMYRENSMNDSILRGIKKMARIFVWSSVLYAIIPLYKCIVTRDFSFFLTSKDILNLLVFNEHPWGYHLWYISAYLYVLLVAFVIEKKQCWKSMLWLILLLLVDLAFGKYSLLIWGREFPYLWTRNWLFVGMPCFLLGTAVKMKKDDIIKSGKKIHTIAWGGVIFFTITSYIERYVLEFNHLNAVRDNYFSSTLLAVCLLIVAISCNRKRENYLSILGNKYSLHIYVFHVFVFSVIYRLMDYYAFFPFWDYLAPFYVLIITIIVIFILDKTRIIKIK